MDEATIALTIMTLAIFIVFLGFLVWGIKSGQFRNVEDQVFRKQRPSGREGEKPGNGQKGEGESNNGS